MGKSKNTSSIETQIIVDGYRQTKNYSETSRVLKIDRKTMHSVVKRCENQGSVKSA